AWKRAAGRVLERVVPRVRLPAELSADALTSDPERQRAWLADPLVQQRVTPRLFYEALRAQRAALAAGASAIAVPVLLLVPLDDPLVDPAVTLTFAGEPPPRGLTVAPLEGLRHEPHNETERARAFAAAQVWWRGTFPTLSAS
ncbi:MAG: hypothetical protein D6701_05510, partial [Gemmatimonadetes bacterium]